MRCVPAPTARPSRSRFPQRLRNRLFISTPSLLARCGADGNVRNSSTGGVSMTGKGLVAAAVSAAMIWPAAASAQQVTGLSASQDTGFTTLKWTPVAGATDYQIERTPVDGSNQPTGAAVIVGVWQPQRTVTPDKPAFA